eukprot:m.15568 g.15568  ORF g.15568 m.15568 type:complete len:170 (-) comp8698_c0_seq1:501-1010(-)
MRELWEEAGITRPDVDTVTHCGATKSKQKHHVFAIRVADKYVDRDEWPVETPYETVRARWVPVEAMGKKGISSDEIDLVRRVAASTSPRPEHPRPASGQPQYRAPTADRVLITPSSTPTHGANGGAAAVAPPKKRASGRSQLSPTKHMSAGGGQSTPTDAPVTRGASSR